MVCFSTLAKFCKPSFFFVVVCVHRNYFRVLQIFWENKIPKNPHPHRTEWVVFQGQNAKEKSLSSIIDVLRFLLKSTVKGLRNQNGAQKNVKCLTGHYIGFLSHCWHHQAEPGISGCQGAEITSASSSCSVIRKGRPRTGSVLFGGNLWEGPWVWGLLGRISLYSFSYLSWDFKSGSFLSCSATRAGIRVTQMRHSGFIC